MSYNNPVLTMNYTFYKLRGGGTMSITGFSNSFIYTEILSHSETVKGLNSKSVTFSVGVLGTSSTTTYVDPAGLTFTFGGTAAPGTTNLRFNLNGLSLGSVTASGTTVSNLLSSVANSLVFSGVNAGFSVTSSSNQLLFSAPTTKGNFNNGVTISMTVTGALSSFTYSPTIVSFSGGQNVHKITVSFGNLGYNSSTTFLI